MAYNRVVAIADPTDPRLADYVDLTDTAMRRRYEPSAGVYLAESAGVIRLALAAGHRPRSLLMAPRWLADLADVVRLLDDEGHPAPIYIAQPEVLKQVTGYHVHRGALAAMARPQLPDVDQVLATARGGQPARRVAIIEDVVDTTNVGAIFRSAAALGVDAVLVTPQCADPLYRRSVRVSMGTVFQVPWARITNWPQQVAQLQGAGFTVAALALTPDAISLDDLAAAPPQRLALVLGTEGDGLAPTTLAAADLIVRIPMAPGVDSLNVAAASAVAFYATR